MTSVIGLEADEARNKLESQGFEVSSIVYASKRGVTDADSLRVIRQRRIGNNSVEITLSRFKTRI